MARLIEAFASEPPAWSRLMKQLNEGRLAHALTITGGSPNERLDLAWALAQSLVCERTQASACGQCGSCLRAELRSHESILGVAPEKNTIKLEAAESILDFLSLQKVSRARIVIIDQAPLLNLQTANALLKAIEEPPTDSYFVLTAQESSQLLPTLRSRTQSVRLAAQAYRADSDDHELLALVSGFLNEAPDDRRESLERIQAESKDREVALRIIRLTQRELRERVLRDPQRLKAYTDLWERAFRVEMGVLANVDRALLMENFFYSAREALR